MIAYLEAFTLPGMPVAILCEDKPDTYALILSCLCSGRPFVPIHPGHPEDRNQRILHQVGLNAPLSGERISIPNHRVNWEVLDQLVDKTNFSDTAYILFTSGSTGNPKGVPISHNALQTFVDACDACGLNTLEGKACLQSFDLTFDLSLFGYLYPWVHGATVCTLPEDEMKQLAIVRILEEECIHTALLVPSVIRLLQPLFNRIELPDLQQLLFCGEALPLDLLREFKTCVPQAQIRNVYGPTEATIFCMEYVLPDNTEDWLSYQGILSIGKPMPGTFVELDEDSQLLLSGNQLSRGYLQADTQRMQAFQERDGVLWYQTGDLARRDNSGNYYFVGRMDQQVKIQGYRVELGEVEFQINQLIAPATAIAVVRQIESDISEINLFIDDLEVDVVNLEEQVKLVLPAYMVPGKWHKLSEFPLNVNGKIDRKALASGLYV
jgi:D-alanine--poly(phosphoribitol) ligase subunit 1